MHPKKQTLLNLEFELQLSHPQVFTSYRAAKRWAEHTLKKHPKKYGGDDHGWLVHVFKTDLTTNQFACSISQYWWNADHCGTERPTGALAIVQVMLEMQAGY